MGDCGSFLGGVVSGMGREGVTDNVVQVMFTSCLTFKHPKIYVFMFCIIRFGSDESLEPWKVGVGRKVLPVLYKQSV